AYSTHGAGRSSASCALIDFTETGIAPINTSPSHSSRRKISMIRYAPRPSPRHSAIALEKSTLQNMLSKIPAATAIASGPNAPFAYRLAFALADGAVVRFSYHDARTSYSTSLTPTTRHTTTHVLTP